MNAKSQRQTLQHTMIVISAGRYRGASLGRKVCGPVCKLSVSGRFGLETREGMVHQLCCRYSRILGISPLR